MGGTFIGVASNLLGVKYIVFTLIILNMWVARTFEKYFVSNTAFTNNMKYAG